MSALLITVLLIYIYFLFSSVASHNSIGFVLFSYISLSLPVFFLYYTYNAADVALTEISIGAFLSFYFFFTTYNNTGAHNINHCIKSPFKITSITLLCSALFSILLYICFLLEDISAENIYSAKYNAYTYANSHIPNIITAILASYRGFDTFGETLIIALASLGVAKITHNDNHSQKI